jgi:hypothetical protein
MAIYRFKVSFEDYDDVTREIDIKSNQTFEDLHLAIHRSTGYPPEQSSSFFVSNDQWIKGDEIAFLPTARKAERGVALMAGTKLSKFIDDPHQKFYYTYNFDRPFDFHVELIKILGDEPGKEYPVIVKSAGEAPKALGPVVPPPGSGEEISEEFDFLNEMEYPEHDTEELESMSEDTTSSGGGGEAEEEEEEKDEFMDEFSDNDNYDSEDYSNRKDDY